MGHMPYLTSHLAPSHSASPSLPYVLWNSTNLTLESTWYYLTPSHQLPHFSPMPSLWTVSPLLIFLTWRKQIRLLDTQHNGPPSCGAGLSYNTWWGTLRSGLHDPMTTLFGWPTGAPEHLSECAWHLHGCWVMFFSGSEKCLSLTLSPVNQDEESFGEKPG